LIRWYLADRGLEALDARDQAVVRHVANCAACASRYERLFLDLDGAADAAVEAADAAFTPEHLMLQRERILRRIDSQSARVLAFPAQEAPGRSLVSVPTMWRWVAAAAAAGLFVGLAAGRWWQAGVDDGQISGKEPVYAGRTIGPVDAGRARPASLTVLDDTFLSEVDTALSAPRTPELEAIDAMTLRVQTFQPSR
jgi:hypothetical protein